jgi:hypothetical protein
MDTILHSMAIGFGTGTGLLLALALPITLLMAVWKDVVEQRRGGARSRRTRKRAMSLRENDEEASLELPNRREKQPRIPDSANHRKQARRARPDLH